MAVKDATIPLLAEIAGLNTQIEVYKSNYDICFNNYNKSEISNIIGWTVSGIELIALIISWIVK